MPLSRLSGGDRHVVISLVLCAILSDGNNIKDLVCAAFLTCKEWKDCAVDRLMTVTSVGEELEEHLGSQLLPWVKKYCCKRLQALECARQVVTIEEMKLLPFFTQLTSLKLGSNLINTCSCFHLHQLTSLTRICLINGAICYPLTTAQAPLDVLPLALLPRLEILVLSGLCINIKDLASTATSLVSLSLDNVLTSPNPITSFDHPTSSYDNHISQLSRLVGLTSLDLSKPQYAMKPQSYRAIAKLTNLRHLNLQLHNELSSFYFTNPAQNGSENLRELCAMSWLTSLNMSRCRLGPQEVHLLATSLTALTELDLNMNLDIENEGLVALSSLTSLQVLNVRACNISPSSEVDKALHKLTNLSSLACFTKIKPNDLKHMTFLTVLTSLCTLCVSCTAAELEQNCVRISKKFPQLRYYTSNAPSTIHICRT